MPIAAELNNHLHDDLQNLGLSPLPSKVNDRKGDPVNVSGYVWRYNTEHTHRSFNWALLGRMHPFIEYALKRYSTYCIETKSELEAYNQINEVASCLRRSPSWEDLWQAEDTEALEDGFKIVIGEIIQHLRDRKRIYRFHRLREFYRFCTDFMPELGFDPEFMIRLDMVFVGGNPKGEAVRREDEEEGPLSREEVEAVRQGLDSAADRKRQDREENAAVALCLAFGRNPANLVLLREQDLKNVLEEHPELPPQLILSIPRIKKRGQIRKRHLFRDEYLEPELAKYLFQLIDGNKEIDTGGLPRPIFMRSKPSRLRIGSPTEGFAYHQDSSYISHLLGRFVTRHNIVSPRTNRQLKLTPRRLRYTFACEMVRQGVSPQALARMLDHSDVQNVQVYFDLRNDIVGLLDKAASERIDWLLDGFKKPLEKDVDAARSTAELLSRLHLNSPYCCYACQKFRPYGEEDHKKILQFLEMLPRLNEGDEGLGLQLGEVIEAVVQVVEFVQAGGGR
jgi:integrase